MRHFKSALSICVLTSFALSTFLIAATLPIYKSLYSFQGLADGSIPYGSPVMHNGNLYGSTSLGGDLSCGYNGSGCGTVYELTPPATKGGAWTESAIYEFKGEPNDGHIAWGSVVFDKKGNLYGVTFEGGNGTLCGNSFGCGTVYELTPPSTSGGNWTETLLYSFQGGTDGAFPASALAIDASGNLIGAATQGGSTACSTSGCGTLFELSPPTISGGAWTETTLHVFTGGTDGDFPQSNLVLGPGGTIYGSGFGGAGDNGSIFALTPSAGSYAFNVIYNFSSPFEGRLPGDIVFRNGNIYGTTAAGPGSSNAGTVFRLAQSGGVWSDTVLFAFGDNDVSTGFIPTGEIAFDQKGNIFGATYAGGNGPCPFGDGCGLIYELSPSTSGAYTETVLHKFQAKDGHYPQGIMMSGTTFFGTANEGGGVCASSKQGCGTIFSIVP